MTNEKKTRRETLTLLGAASVTMLVGCGGEDTTGTKGTGNTPGAGGDGTSPGAGGGGGTASSAGGAGGSTSGGGGTGTAGGGAGTGGGGTGSGATSAGGAPEADGGDAVVCASKTETTVGPYPNINPLERRDVRGNTTGVMTPKDGAALTLRVRVLDLDGACAPIPGAVVDVWQCDAVGVYAGYAPFNTTGQDFCRGYQSTNGEGVAEFLTIFPGSYAGRAIHIHFSVQGTETKLNPNAEGRNLPGIFVAQLYFERAVADAIFAATPVYQQGAAITANEADGIFSGAGGAALIVRMTKSGNGYVGEIDVGVKRSDVGR